MKWMNLAGAEAKDMKLYAGLYVRTPGYARFLGLGEPAANRPADKPWAPLAEWLRAAHAMIGSEPAAAASANPSVSAGVTAPAAPYETIFGTQAPTARKKLRFVCNRRFVGFVLR